MPDASLPYLAHTRPLADAADLIARYGGEARDEATTRANRSRELGNHIHFCRWRQVARLVSVMTAERAVGTVH